MPRATVAVCLPAAALLAGCGAGSHHSLADQQATVRARGQQVMPFRLDRTTHIFAKTATGGVESVVAKTQADGAQIPLIREHLRKERSLFSRRNFKDPMATHGMNMPGIDTLRHEAAQISISYRPLARGAQLRYTTASQQVREALHAWFDAQLMDHGADARP